MALRVGIDARLISGSAGGLETVIIGLAHGLSQLRDDKSEYHFLVYDGAESWLKPYLAGSCRLLCCPIPPLERLKRLANHFPIVRRDWWRAFQRLFGRHNSASLPYSTGNIERAGLDLIHFVRQQAFITDVPSIYHPHDLQHLHLPESFDAEEIASRESSYRAFCTRSKLVVVTSSWVKNDLIRQYGLPDDKVRVVVWPPVLNAYPTPTAQDLDAAKRKFALPEDFVFYPAQTWPHKNHINLLVALAQLRDRHGLQAPFVSSGRLTEFYPSIRRRIRELDLDNQVRFLGFVSPLELRILYRLCRCVVVPSKFEAASGPLSESFLARAPAACSNVTSLPAQAGDSALVFDPDQPEAIAAAIYSLWTDAALRNDLVERGTRNIARFTWDHCARLFRAHYRQLAQRPLRDEDLALLAAPPLL